MGATRHIWLNTTLLVDLLNWAHKQGDNVTEFRTIAANAADLSRDKKRMLDGKDLQAVLNLIHSKWNRSPSTAPPCPIFWATNGSLRRYPRAFLS